MKYYQFKWKHEIKEADLLHSNPVNEIELLAVIRTWGGKSRDKKIDGIYAYYDRIPIIEAAKKNFLASADKSAAPDSDMVVQLIKIKSRLTEEALLRTAKDRTSTSRAMPGLLQKYYIRLSESG